MLVLHPSTFIDTDGPLDDEVCVSVGIDVLVLRGSKVGWLVFVATPAVAIWGVAVATPITTGVGVNMNGVGVAGKKGVGPGKG